ncbi:MAG: hypothetical protein RBU21_24925 [FCB group bacterium]|jgi:hypothetical protein|nr:hypothetical protein [FCB group bacterium]
MTEPESQRFSIDGLLYVFPPTSENKCLRGLARMDLIAYAVLERNGGITIIPKENEPLKSA